MENSNGRRSDLFEYFTAPKFVQICPTCGTYEGETITELYALDEEGRVWTFNDNSKVLAWERMTNCAAIRVACRCCPEPEDKHATSIFHLTYDFKHGDRT